MAVIGPWRVLMLNEDGSLPAETMQEILADSGINTIVDGIPSLVDAAVTAQNIPGKVNAAVSGLSLPQVSVYDLGTDDVLVIGDEEGRPSWMRANRFGGMSAAAIAAVYAAGFILTTGNGNGWVLADADGNESWVRVGPDGRPDEQAKWAIANAIHLYSGPIKPIAYKGNYIDWFDTSVTPVQFKRVIGE